MTTGGPRRLSRVLLASWAALVGAASLLVVAVAAVPNEIRDHLPVWSYGVPFVLVVAVAGLPLLVGSWILDRRAGRDDP